MPECVDQLVPKVGNEAGVVLDDQHHVVITIRDLLPQTHVAERASDHPASKIEIVVAEEVLDLRGHRECLTIGALDAHKLRGSRWVGRGRKSFVEPGPTIGTPLEIDDAYRKLVESLQACEDAFNRWEELVFIKYSLLFASDCIDSLTP